MKLYNLFYATIYLKYIIMKNLIANIVSVITLLTLSSVNAQVLFSDDFESYNVGPFLINTNGWQVNGFYNDVRIFPEPNRGNVLAWGWNITPLSAYSIASCIQYDILKKLNLLTQN